MWKPLAGALCFVLFCTSATAIPIHTDQVPRLRGDTWAVADTDGEYVVMFTFEPGKPGEGRAMMYSYDVPTETLKLEWNAPYTETGTGYVVKDSSGNPHTIEIAEDGLIFDGSDVLPASPIDEVVRVVLTVDCLDDCRRNACSGDFLVVCCPCCFCSHACMGISFMDGLCCVYLWGC